MVDTTPMYNYTDLENASGLIELFDYINVNTDSLFLPLILVGIFLVIYMGLQRYLAEKAFIAAGYSTSLVALLFWASGLTHYGFAFTFFLLTSVVMLVVRVRR